MSLENLPTELITEICEIVDKKTLMALRLANKRISNSATKSFSDRFMSSLSLILTAPCLERLIEICEHPCFGPAIRKIEITSSRITNTHIEHLVSERTRLIEDTGDQREGVARAELMLQRCKDRYKDEEALEEDGGATSLLTRAFAALQIWAYDVELSIVPNRYIHDGAIFLYRDCFEFMDSSFLWHCLNRTFQPCLDAIRISRMKFCKLGIESEGGRSKNFGQKNFDLGSFTKEDTKLFSLLRSITSELARTASYDTRQAITTIVSQACELEVLRLSYGDNSFHFERWNSEGLRIQFDLGDDALRSVKSNRIESLSFTQMSFSKQCLMEFLDRHRKTLKTLRLTLCGLRDGLWHEVISYMQKSLPLLNTLSIGRLFNSNYGSVPRAIAGFGREWVKGEEKVQAALSTMIERPLQNPLTLEYTLRCRRKEQDEEDTDN